MSAFVAPCMCSPSPAPTPSSDPSSSSSSSPSSPPPPPSQPPLPPRYRRSKLLLTRRVHSVMPSPPLPAPSLSPTQQSAPYLPTPHTYLSPTAPRAFAPEDYLAPNPALPTYFFARGYPYPRTRRAGDPPARYLELRFGAVGPDSPLARHCACPRPGRRLKRWYASAMRWRALQKDFRDTIVLGDERRVGGRRGKQVAKMRGVLPPSLLIPPDEKIEEPNKFAVATPLPLSPLMVPDGLTVNRALARSPRVIAIGDIHGCIDEFQALLRLADYQPGDQIVLLGDLVAKGPDSVGVVQMARDLGARTVRGNHDHEVICWTEEAKGVRSNMISMEHSRIADALSPDDHAWLLESPWFISCPDTQHLFVHAGFIPGVKLTQQNPRLMMNMRSVLNDGTVTAKNVVDCEWAKLWRGPETVVFGHDANRGLQEHPFAKGIDTGCVYGGRLTAYILPERRYLSVAAKRCYIRERRFRHGRKLF